MSAVNLLTCAAVAPGIGEDLLPCSPGTLAIVDPDWFDPALWLPGTRHRYLNDTTRYALAAARRCPDPCTDGGVAPERLALCFGTSVADVSVRHLFDQAVAHGETGCRQHRQRTQYLGQYCRRPRRHRLSGPRAMQHRHVAVPGRLRSPDAGHPGDPGRSCRPIAGHCRRRGDPEGAGAAILPGAVALRLGDARRRTVIACGPSVGAGSRRPDNCRSGWSTR